MDLLLLLKTTFVDKLDTTLATLAITILLFFYGTGLVRRIIAGFKKNKTVGFIIFLLMAFFGLNLLLVILVGLVIAAPIATKWVIIGVLNLWAFYKFDREMMKK